MEFQLAVPRAAPTVELSAHRRAGRTVDSRAALSAVPWVVLKAAWWAVCSAVPLVAATAERSVAWRAVQKVAVSAATLAV